MLRSVSRILSCPIRVQTVTLYPHMVNVKFKYMMGHRWHVFDLTFNEMSTAVEALSAADWSNVKTCGRWIA